MCGSILSMVAMSTERFLAIVYVLKARHLRTRSSSLKAVCLVWVLGFVIAVPNFFSPETGYRISTNTDRNTYMSIFKENNLLVQDQFIENYLFTRTLTSEITEFRNVSAMVFLYAIPTFLSTGLLNDMKDLTLELNTKTCFEIIESDYFTFNLPGRLKNFTKNVDCELLNPDPAVCMFNSRPVYKSNETFFEINIYEKALVDLSTLKSRTIDESSELSRLSGRRLVENINRTALNEILSVIPRNITYSSLESLDSDAIKVQKVCSAYGSNEMSSLRRLYVFILWILLYLLPAVTTLFYAGRISFHLRRDFNANGPGFRTVASLGARLARLARLAFQKWQNISGNITMN